MKEKDRVGHSFEVAIPHHESDSILDSETDRDRDSAEVYFGSAAEIMLHQKLPAHLIRDMSTISQRIERERCNADFIYFLLASTEYTARHDAWAALAGRYLYRLVRVIPNRDPQSMVPVIVRMVTGVDSVGNLSELFPEHVYENDVDHTKVVTNVFTAFNIIQGYIENWQTGWLKGNEIRDFMLRKKTLATMIVLICLHYDISFFYLVTDQRVGCPFFDRQCFLTFWKTSLGLTITKLLNGKYEDCYMFLQETLVLYSQTVPFDPYLSIVPTEKPPCIIPAGGHVATRKRKRNTSDSSPPKNGERDRLNLSNLDCIIGN